MRTAKIRRNKHLGDRDYADPRIGKLIGNQLIQFLAHIFRDSFVAVCGHNCTIAKVKRTLLLATLFSAAAWAQPLSVYSEFARINASGEVTAPETPREILSPALVRNGFASFQVVVQAPADRQWWLFLSQNPENAVKLSLYRESGDSLEPALEPIEVPRQSRGTEVLWMDVWTAATTPVERIKIEPELHFSDASNDDWVIYPIEGRVVEARVPDTKGEPGLCPLAPSTAASGMRRLQLRNAAQDSALAARVSKDELAKLRVFCDTPAPLRWSENYLRIRDYLFSLR
jgi:hypothetical protein